MAHSLRLPAAAPGEELLRDVTLDAYVRDRSPTVSFSGRAYVLPKTAEAALPVTTITPPSRNADYMAQAYSITVSSNTTWTVGGFPSWVTVSPSGGSGNGTVSVTLQENPATAARSGSLSINGNSHVIVQGPNPVDLAYVSSLNRQIKKLKKKQKATLIQYQQKQCRQMLLAD